MSNIKDIPFAAFCEECGSDLEIADFDTVRVRGRMVIQLNVKPCPKCLEQAEESGEDNHQRKEDAMWDARRDR